MVWSVVGVRECVCAVVIYLFCFCEMEGRCRTQSNDNTTIESSSIISYQDMIEIIRDLKDQVKESKEESKELSMKLEETLGKQRLQDELMKREMCQIKRTLSRSSITSDISSSDSFDGMTQSGNDSSTKKFSRPPGQRSRRYPVERWVSNELDRLDDDNDDDQNNRNKSLLFDGDQCFHPVRRIQSNDEYKSDRIRPILEIEDFEERRK